MWKTFTNPAQKLKNLATYFLTLGTAIALALALAPTPANAAAGQIRISAQQVGKQHNLALGLNKSMIVHLPIDVKEMVVSNPEIVRATMRTKRRAIIQSAALGETNILFLNANGTPVAVIDVSVRNSANELESMLARLIPGSNITAHATADSLVLSGTAASSDDEQKAIKIAAQFVKGSKDAVSSVIDVSGAQQVMLKVTVAEVQRETVKQLGIDLSSTLSVGGLSTTVVSSPGLGGVSNVVAPNSMKTGFSLGNLSVDATIRALERRGAVRTLAEPTLTALSGAKAEFLAGGEFPVPVGYSDGEITYEFKEFGVNLGFTPTVHTGGEISLEVETSVSELNAEGGYTAGPVNISATKERKAKTSVKLYTGSTLAIAGLIEEKYRQRFNEVPGLGRIPILGTLFRSRDFIRAETELLILVTPYLTEPGHREDFILPTDKMQIADDASAYFLGQLEKLYGVGGDTNGELKGSIGFVLD